MKQVLFYFSVAASVSRHTHTRSCGPRVLFSSSDSPTADAVQVQCSYAGVISTQWSQPGAAGTAETKSSGSSALARLLVGRVRPGSSNSDKGDRRPLVGLSSQQTQVIFREGVETWFG